MERGLHRGVSRKENKEESDNLEYRITKKDLGNWDNSLVIPICEIQYSIFVNILLPTAINYHDKGINI